MEEVEVEAEAVGKKGTSSGGRDDDKKRSGKQGPKRRLLAFMKRLQLRETSPSKWRWRFLGSGRWHVSFMDDVLFKIVSAIEAVILIATLCFFFLCCGCHF